MVGRAYAAVFARPKMQGVNHALYHLALRGMGYNNGWQLPGSGGLWFIREVLAPAQPGTCVDVGSNRGDYTSELLRSTRSDVVAFEPLPNPFHALTEIAARYPGRLVPVKTAVGAEVGVADLHYGSDDSDLASLSAEVNAIDWLGATNTRVMSVPVTTLDVYFAESPTKQPIDSIKIATAGYEYEVLLGAQQTIERFRPRFIQIEMNLYQLFRGQSLRSLAGLLPDYTPHQLLPHGMRPVDPGRPEPNTFCYSNFVFIRHP
jgi:FkbM family methyltransferase